MVRAATNGQVDSTYVSGVCPDSRVLDVVKARKLNLGFRGVHYSFDVTKYYSSRMPWATGGMLIHSCRSGSPSSFLQSENREIHETHEKVSSPSWFYNHLQEINPMKIVIRGKTTREGADPQHLDGQGAFSDDFLASVGKQGGVKPGWISTTAG